MSDTTPESNQLNEDSLSGLFKIMALFSNPTMQQGTEDDANSYFAVNTFSKLTPNEISNIFRGSFLAKKLIEKYPQEAKNFGYEMLDSKGQIIHKNDKKVLEIVYEGSIWARLYGMCFVVFEYDKSTVKEVLKPGEILKGARYEFELKKEGDYFVKEEKEYIHESKVQVFYGRKSYIPYLDKYDENYADSIYQSLVISFKNYISSNETVRKILSNISFLLLGIKNLGNMSKSDRGQSEVYHRLASIRTNRSVNRVIAYDKENEVLNYISQSTTGINELISNIKDIFIAESDYPTEQLFEEAGKSNMGNGIANQLIARFLWARRCHGFALESFLPHYQTFFDRHNPGVEFTINIPFMMVLTQMEQAELEKFASERTKNLVESNVITTKEARTGYITDKFDLNIILDDENYLNNIKISDKTNLDSGVFVPDDNTWDALTSVTDEDLTEIMEGALNGKP